MRRKFVFYTIILCLVMVGCTTNNAEKIKEDTEVTNEGNNEGDGDKTMDGIDIYDFYFINKAPLANEKHSFDQLIKVYFSYKGIAVDVKNKELYEKPRFSTNGVTTFEDPIKFEDKEGLVDILEKYDVQQWKENYTTEDPDSYQDGFGWQLMLQFEDGTVEKYRGSGSFKEDVIPDNFEQFSDEIEAFIEDKIMEQK